MTLSTASLTRPVLWLLLLCTTTALEETSSSSSSSTSTSASSATQHQQQQQQRRRILTPNYPGDTGHRRAGVTVPVPTDPEEQRVTNLPLLDEGTLNVPHYAGLLPAGDSDHKYFFSWFFYPDIPQDYPMAEKEADIPLVIWLNGGPGCSSMDGLFLEHGPLQLKLNHESQEWKLEARQSSWHKSPAYIVYVDQPVGTGLSFTTKSDYPSSDELVNRDFYGWLLEFVKLHKNVLLNEDGTSLKRPLYFSGESHAGHYIPSMMAYIQEQNLHGKSKLSIPVTGAAIGNGWIDPFHQYAAAAAAYGHGIIGRSQLFGMEEMEKRCQADLARGTYVSNVCFDLLDVIVNQSEGKTSRYKVSQYDIRQREAKHGSRDFPPGHHDVESYLGGFRVQHGPAMPDVALVLEALHATPSRTAGQVFQECTDPPFNALSHQDGKGVVQEVISLLNDGVRLLFFNGIMDLICNHVGNEVLLEKMEWKNQHEWITASRYAWESETTKTVMGYMKEFENLSFLKILDSGHMPPLDQPEASLDMMSLFLFDKSFKYSKQELPSSEEKTDAATTTPPASSSGGGGDQKSCPECPTCPASSESSNASIDPNQDSVLKFVIAHSWLGAIFAVVIFLMVCMLVRSKQQRSSSSLPYNNNGGLVEMKPHYRDNDGYRDDDDDDDHHVGNDELQPATNGTML